MQTVLLWDIFQDTSFLGGSGDLEHTRNIKCQDWKLFYTRRIGEKRNHPYCIPCVAALRACAGSARVSKHEDDVKAKCHKRNLLWRFIGREGD